MSLYHFLLLKTCFMFIFSGKLKLVLFIIKKNPCLKYYCINDDNLISYTYMHKREYLASLLSAKVSPNIRDTAGSTVLMSACSLGDYDIAKLLLENGAIADLTNNLGDSAYSHAEANGNYECMELVKSVTGRKW